MDPSHIERSLTKRLVTKPTDPDGLILEAWAQGFMVGALIIMSFITAANMRAGVLLHKIILIELLFGIWHGFFIFNHAPVYGWYLSVSAVFLNISWSLHNVIAWMKNKPFLSRKVSLMYILSVAAVQPYWVVEVYANFTYFNNINSLFLHTRPFEALFRDPWWVFTICSLFYNIKTRYEMSLIDIVRISPRFAIMILAMALSICFLITDICSVTDAFKSSLPVGINPFWKLSFVFKCLTDCVILDDFKTALDRLRAFKISRIGSFAADGSVHERAWRPGLTNDHHPWAMKQLGSNDDDKIDDEPNPAFTSHTTTRVTACAQRGESSASATDAYLPRSEENKTTADHIEATRQMSKDRDEIVENPTGITSKRMGLKGRERSWLSDPDGSSWRGKRQGDKSCNNDTGEADPGSDRCVPRDLEVGLAR